MKENFWEGRKVSITGANGFIGSWLTETLSEKGAYLTILIKKDSPIGTDSIKHLMGKVKIVYGNIKDSSSVEKLVKDKEFVFHLAAVTQVIYAKNNPREAFEVNANGTLNVLEALRKNKENAFLVFASTDKVYGEPKQLPITEDHPLLSKSPYDAAKLAADRLVHSYHLTYGINSGIVRWSNTIGGRDSNFLRVVPDFINSVIKQTPPTIRGNGKHIRDYMYVLDSVNGIMSIGEKSNVSNGDVFNIGTEKPTSVLELANLIIKLMGKEGKMRPVVLNKDTSGEIDKQYLSSKKAVEKLGWKPAYNLEQSLKETIKWYKSNPKWSEVMERVKNYYKLEAKW